MVTTITATSTETAIVDAICDERDFYVDATGGDNGNDGRTPETAWKTIGKVNSETFVAGDHILFKRGETFSGKLLPEDSGVLGNPIVYGVYGAGARPIIDGSADKAWVILASAAHHLYIESIDFSGSINTSQHVVQSITHDQYWYDCIFRDGAGGTAGNGIGFMAYDGGAGADLYNITLDTCVAHDNSASGISIGSGTGASGPHDCLITHCETYANGTTSSLDHGIYVRHGVVVEWNNCHNNPVGGGIKVNDQADYDSPYHPIVRNNISNNNYIGLVLDNNGTIVYNNLIYSNDLYAISMSNSTFNCLVYFNTCVNSTVTSIGLIYATGAGCINNAIKNNLFIQDATVKHTWNFQVRVQTFAEFLANNDVDYNIYYHNGILYEEMVYEYTASLGRTFEAKAIPDGTSWQENGGDPNGIHIIGAVPGFVTNYSDLHPDDGGNLDGHDGLAIAGYMIDLDENARAYPPNIGCYEEASA